MTFSWLKGCMNKYILNATVFKLSYNFSQNLAPSDSSIQRNTSVYKQKAGTKDKATTTHTYGKRNSVRNGPTNSSNSSESDCNTSKIRNRLVLQNSKTDNKNNISNTQELDLRNSPTSSCQTDSRNSPDINTSDSIRSRLQENSLSPDSSQSDSWNSQSNSIDDASECYSISVSSFQNLNATPQRSAFSPTKPSKSYEATTSAHPHSNGIFGSLISTTIPYTTFGKINPAYEPEAGEATIPK